MILQEKINGTQDDSITKTFNFSKKEIIKLLAYNNRPLGTIPEVVTRIKPVGSKKESDLNSVFFYDLFTLDIEPYYNSDLDRKEVLREYQLDEIISNLEKYIQKQITVLPTVWSQTERVNVNLVD